MKYIKYSLLFIAVGLASACSDEFLTIKPYAIDSEETFYKDLDALDMTVISAYAQLSARDIWDIHYSLAFGSAPGDDAEAGGESTSDWPQIQNFDRFTHSKNDAINCEEFYRYCYKGLRLCNTVLEKIPEVKSKDKNATQAKLNQREAEVRFLRAWYHFALTQVFGGVPLATRTVQPKEFETPKSTIKEVYAVCEDDLKFAAANLPVSGTEPGRATKGAAQALIARLLMFESGYAENYPGDARFEGCKVRYQEALDYAKLVINSPKYSLVGAGGERFNSWWGTPDSLDYAIDNPGQKKVGGFRWLFTVDGDNSSEGIFEIQSVRDGKGWGYTRGNVLTVYQTARKYNGFNAKGEPAVLDAGGWCFNSPSPYLVKAFQNSDPRETGLNSTPGLETDDPRFSTTVGRAGDSIRVNVKKVNKWVPINFDNLPTGMIGRKFECSYEEFWSGGQVFEGPFNIRLIRLADIILLAAEASFKLNDKAAALSYVNMVRTRARLSGDTGLPADLTAISFEDIVHERRLELALEPHRFFDLVRWNLTGKFLNNINLVAVGPDFKTEFVPGKHEFWPIPISEVQLSKGAIKQYPAWE